MFNGTPTQNFPVITVPLKKEKDIINTSIRGTYIVD